MFNKITRNILEKNNMSNDVDIESLTTESKDTKTAPKNDSIKSVRASLQEALKVISLLQDRITALEKINNNTSTDKCSTCHSDIKRIKDILGINDAPKPNCTLNSHNSEPELAKIHKARHIVNIGDLIHVDKITWKYGGSHSEQIMALFGNSQAIVKIYQLKPKVVNGKSLYPVNIYFSSEVASDKAISILKSVCDKAGKRMPTVQYALTGFPTLQKRVRDVSSILSLAKQNKEITAYSIMNFSMAKDKSIIPLYSVKVTENGPWSKYIESRTINPDSASNGHIFQESTNTEEAQIHIQTLTGKIMEHIQSLDRTNTSINPKRNIQQKTNKHNTPSDSVDGINNYQNSNPFINSTHQSKRGRSSSSSPFLHATKKQFYNIPSNDHHNTSPFLYSPPQQTHISTSPPPLQQLYPITSVPTVTQHPSLAPVHLHTGIAPQGYNHSNFQTHQQTYNQQQNPGLTYNSYNV